jgi:hypothetical protein
MDLQEQQQPQNQIDPRAATFVFLHHALGVAKGGRTPRGSARVVGTIEYF